MFKDAIGGNLRPHPISATEVADRLALDHLVCTYGHAVDRRDYVLLQSLYHDDAIDDHSPYFCGPAQEYVKWLPTMMSNWALTSHSMTNKVFVIDGEKANGIISARSWHLTLDRQSEFIAYGRYVDHYEKRQNVWRFSHRFFAVDHAFNRPIAGSAMESLAGVEIAKAGGDDAVFTRTQMFSFYSE